jgi:predicted murein hydrolase (TIGR00659 family)
MSQTWEAIRSSPIFGIGLTVGVYAGSVELHRRARQHALLTPVFVAIVVVASVNSVLGIEYRDYLASVAPISLLLGPATVALALPLMGARASLRKAFVPVLVSVTCGCVLAIGSAGLISRLLGAPDELTRSLLTRSVTTPVALGLAETVGAVPALAAALAIVSGVLGAVIGPRLLSLIGVRTPGARGFAIGVASHGIGTARALQESTIAGGWSSAGMALAALLTTAVLPFLAPLLVPG